MSTRRFSPAGPFSPDLKRPMGLDDLSLSRHCQIHATPSPFPPQEFLVCDPKAELPVHDPKFGDFGHVPEFLLSPILFFRRR